MSRSDHYLRTEATRQEFIAQTQRTRARHAASRRSKKRNRTTTFPERIQARQHRTPLQFLKDMWSPPAMQLPKLTHATSPAPSNTAQHDHSASHVSTQPASSPPTARVSTPRRASGRKAS